MKFSGVITNDKGDVHAKGQCQMPKVKVTEVKGPFSRHRAIIWTNAGILLIETLGTNLSEISIEINPFSFKKMYLKCRLENGGHVVSASMW